MADLYYIEEGYYDVGYFTYVADAACAVAATATLDAASVIVSTAILDAESAIVSTTTLDAAVSVIKSAEATLSVEFTQDAIGSRTKDIDLYAFSEAAINIVVDRIRDNNVAVDVSFDIATDGRRFRDVSADDYAEFSLVSIEERSRAFDISMQAAFSFNATITIISVSLIEGDAALAAEFTQETTAINLRESAVSLSSEFAQSAQGELYKEGPAALASEFTQDTSVDKILSADASLASEFTQDTNTDKIIDGSSTTTATTDLTASLDGTLEVSASLENTTELSATISHIHGADLSAFSDAQLAADAEIIKGFDVGLASQFDTAASIDKLVGYAADLSSTAAQTADVNILYEVSATISAATTLTADYTNVQYVSANLSASTALSATGYINNKRPRQYTVTGSAVISTSTKKFGAGSLYVPAGSYATMPDSNDWDSWTTVDFHHYSTSTATQSFIGQGTTSGNTSWAFNVVNNRYNFFGYNFSNVLSSISWDNITTNTWNHVRLIRNGSSISLYVNGTKLNPTITNGTIPTSFRSSTQPVYIGDSLFAESGNFYIDELLIRNDYTLGDGSAGSITVPTAKWQLTSQSNVLVLSHFDTNLSDDLSLLASASATLSSQFTQSATAQKVVYGMAGLNTAVSIDISNNNIVDFIAVLAVEGFELISGTRIQNTSAALSAQFTQSTVAGPVRDADAALSATATLTADTDLSRIRNASAAFEAFNTELVEGMRVRLASANLTSTTSLTAAATRTRRAVGALAATVTQTASIEAIEGPLNLSSWIHGIRSLSTDYNWHLEDFILDEDNEVIYELLRLDIPVNNEEGTAIISRNAKTGNVNWTKFYQFDYGEQYYDETTASNLTLLDGKLYWTISDYDPYSGWKTNIYKLDIASFTITTWVSPIDVIEKMTSGGTDIYATGWTFALGQVTWTACRFTPSGSKVWTATQTAVTNQPRRGYGIAVNGDYVYLAVDWDSTSSQVFKLDKTNGNFVLTATYSGLDMNNLITDSLGQMWVSGRTKFAQLNTDLTLGISKQAGSDIDDIWIDRDSGKVYIHTGYQIFRANYTTNTVDWATSFSDASAWNGNDEPTYKAQIQPNSAYKFYWTSPRSPQEVNVQLPAIGRSNKLDGGLFFSDISYRDGLTGTWSYSKVTPLPTIQVFSSTVTTSSATTSGSLGGTLATSSLITEFTPSYADYVYVNAIWGFGAFTSTSTLTAVNSRTRAVNKDLVVTATVVTVGNVARLGRANLSTTATMTTVAVKATTVTPTLSAQFALTAVNTRRRDALAPLAVTATVSSSAVKTARASSALTSQFTATTTNTRIRDFDTSFESIATELTAAAKNATGTVSMDATTSLAVTAKITREVAAGLSAEFTQVSDVENVVGYGSNFVVTASMTVDNARTRDVNAALTSTATMTVSVTKTTGYSANIASQAQLASQGRRIRFGQGNLSTQVTLTVAAQRIKEVAATLESQFTGVFLITKVIRVEAHLQAFDFVVVAGRILAIDPYLQFQVEPESRLWIVLPESRVFQVEEETRINLIL